MTKVRKLKTAAKKKTTQPMPPQAPPQPPAGSQESAIVKLMQNNAMLVERQRIAYTLLNQIEPTKEIDSVMAILDQNHISKMKVDELKKAKKKNNT